MDLIEKIKKSFHRKQTLISPLFDIHFDVENKIVGYVADEIFEDKSDEESQELIWKTLTNFLSQEELNSISAIFHETPQEKSNRLTVTNLNKDSEVNFWLHETPDLSKYWLFIDILNIDENYKSVVIIINEKNSFPQRITTYTNDVIQFMGLVNENEIKDELYSNTIKQAEASIKFDLMKKYEKLTKKGLWGKYNRFNYVFENFKINPILKKDLIFNKEETVLLEKELVSIGEFKMKKDLEEGIKISKIIKPLNYEAV
ncbi:MAG: hypothetical protein Q9M50_09000 [Methylococcales bacterium]|nr:hypothetical protein [Methylococcales bacterium]